MLSSEYYNAVRVPIPRRCAVNLVCSLTAVDVTMSRTEERVNSRPQIAQPSFPPLSALSRERPSTGDSVNMQGAAVLSHPSALEVLPVEVEASSP